MSTLGPYDGKDVVEWPQITKSLVDAFPLSKEEIVSSVKESWDQLFSSRIGGKLLVGTDIVLPPQANGVILERLIALHLANKHGGWRSGATKLEKDVVRDSDPEFSFEIKTSSSTKGVFGNRSTGNRTSRSTKQRSGYYLVINYEAPTDDDLTKYIRSIRFGWIDDDDWVGQASASGQQASISKQVAAGKLITLYSR